MTGRESAVAEALAAWLDRDDVSENRAADEVRARVSEVGAAVLAALDTRPALGEDDRAAMTCHRPPGHDGAHGFSDGPGPCGARRAADTEWCRRCGGPNVIWSAASPLWNLVMRGNDINGEIKYRDLVCMPCFILCAVEAGLPANGWRLTLVPEPEGLIYETPSGRVWDAERFLWVEPQRGTGMGGMFAALHRDRVAVRAHQPTPPARVDGLCVCHRHPVPHERSAGLDCPSPTPPEQAEAVAVRAAVETQVGYLELTAKQIREQGDVAQVLLSDDGVGQAPSLADELWVIAYNIRAALTPERTTP